MKSRKRKKEKDKKYLFFFVCIVEITKSMENGIDVITFKYNLETDVHIDI